ncbi:MAG: response regulator transcription factor [Anaerolineae bacterium]|nr:response regulator transcription factor [Anaerolineae bacterium]
MDALRILIADDHPLFRDGVRLLLSTAPDMVIIGEATNGDETVQCAIELQPDVILMDIKMPGINGIEATRRILQANPQIRILIVTMFEDDASVFTAMRAGARGYILKDAEQEDILRAIRAVGRGEAIFGPEIAARLSDLFNTGNPAVPRELFPTLTAREREILQLMVQGASNAEMAQLLSLTGKTIANYISNIFSKMQVATREEAVRRVQQASSGPAAP